MRLNEVPKEKEEYSGENVCEFCNESFSCSILKTAVEMLRSEVAQSSNENHRRLEKTFENKLKKYGFEFPLSSRYCDLHDKRKLVEKLTNEASNLLTEIRRRR